MRNIYLIALAFLCVLFVALSSVQADESEVVKDETRPAIDENLSEIMLRLDIDLEGIRQTLSGAKLTVHDYRSLERGIRKLVELNPTKEEFIALDASFVDGVTTAEFLEFLVEFGKKSNRPGPKGKSIKSAVGPVEEVVVYAYSFNAVPMNPAEFSMSDIHQLRSIRA